MAEEKTAYPESESETEEAEESETEEAEESETEEQLDNKEPKSASASSKTTDESTKRFSLKMIHNMLSEKFTSGTVKKEAAVFLTAVLEYLAAEILELSTNVALSRSKGQTRALKVTQDDITEAIETDPALKELFENVRKN